MKIALALLVIVASSSLVRGELPPIPSPPDRDGPLATVHRERYIACQEAGAAPAIDVSHYLGPGLRRREIRVVQAKSDVAEHVRARFSDDNGRNWSPLEKLAVSSNELQQGEASREIMSRAVHYDPVSRRCIETFNERTFLGDPLKANGDTLKGDKKCFDHALYRLSSDEGRTWTERRPLHFEEGKLQPADNWADPEYLWHNQGVTSYAIISLADGRIAIPGECIVPYEEDELDRKICRRVPWLDTGQGRITGTICFIGAWNAARGDYDWQASRPVTVPRRLSTRGLSEPALAQLTDGRILLDMRGSNAKLDPKKYPGRHWFSISQDQGITWSTPTDLRYDDGESFYAPSTFARLVRSGKNGRLYWIGNISAEPSNGNYPRCPLYLAEVDEDKVALKRKTLTVIDDRAPGESERVQLSNFALIDNRETKELEVYLTRYDERPDNVFSADAYKYTITLKD